jgi:copper chaperone CopZ
MENIILDLPSMYGDHHVLKVRDALADLEGIEELYASSAWRQLMISFDPKRIKQADIEQALADAGYPLDEGEPPALVEASDIKRDPKWAELDIRVTETNQADIEMSGEFRRY